MMLRRFLQKMNRVLVPTGMGGLIIMMGVVSANVFGRIFFGAPVYGTVEIVGLTGVIFVSLILPYTQLQGENIIVNVLVDKLPPRLRAVTKCFTLFLSMAIVAALAWTGSVRAVEMTQAKEITAIFRIAQAPFRFVWVFGCVIFFAVLVAQFIESLLQVIQKEKENDSSEGNESPPSISPNPI
jgi:TRAP-type transport system small permease protein